MIQIAVNSYIATLLTALILLLTLPTLSLAQSDSWGLPEASTLGESNLTEELPSEILVVEDEPTAHVDAEQTQATVPPLGLLGKSYFHVSYTNWKYESYWRGETFVHGFAAELNIPIESLRKERSGADFFGRFEHSYHGTSSYDLKFNLATFGIRKYWLLKNSSFRPYVSLLAGFGGHGRGDTNFTGGSSIGLEADLSAQVTSRHEIDAYFTGGSLAYDGSLIFWATDRNFLRGGVEILFQGGTSRFSFGIGRLF